MSTSKTPAWSIVLFALSWLGFLPVGAVEPWADARLSITNGLELWYDVARQAAARRALELAPLLAGQPVDYLPDASGHARHLVQPAPDHRPRYRQEQGGAWLRFDGTNDNLSASLMGTGSTNVTLFIVAAPRSNAGFFRALCAFSQTGRNDYTSGLNLDLGPAGGLQLSFANAEGPGFGGVANLWQGSPRPFGAWHVFSLGTTPGPQGVAFQLDGQRLGTRARNPGRLRLDTFVLGARHYSNSAEPPFTQGFFHGDISEALLYSRLLDETQMQAVTGYLTNKHSSLLALPPGAQEGTQRLVAVSNPPPVQMFLPGFDVRELPLTLPNINNVKYRPDGKLVAMGYNGKVYLLSDTDGDGLEDRASLFWDQETTRSPIGLALTPPGYARGQGVFVPAKGKLSLIIDTNNDDRADMDIAAATWTEKNDHGVDGLGVALDRSGQIYFGLGAASFTGAYLVEPGTGKARYRLDSERGTILKLSPDFAQREIFCTGIRFSVALAVNREGDLFCTDQEGATWLPNGNPLDELLHLQPGRHYGFPPRHPKHLPNVIDEPSVFDYGPQHQSTCGLNFNELPAGSASAQATTSTQATVCFGPKEWLGDALVAGYSRGKLYRTKLVKTSHGHVAQNQLLACLQALTVDACVSPRGDLIVATHSGQPDWGTGPNGLGKLYRIRYLDSERPQPMLAWWANPTQLEIAFNRPLDPSSLKHLTRASSLTQGKHVFPGDRFEMLRPGYQVIFDQLTAPRRDVPILSASLTADHRTLRLTTAPQRAPVHYALVLPASIVAPPTQPPLALDNSGGTPLRASRVHDEIDLLSDLTGVEAQWIASGGLTNWVGWLPHVDLTVSRALTRSSLEHDRLWQHLASPGTLTLRGQLDLWRMLQPATQPGATLDYEPPVEEVTIRLTSRTRARIRFADRPEQSLTNTGANWITSHQARAEENRWVPFVLTVESGPETPALELTWSTALDPQTARVFPLRRLLVPWAVSTEGSLPAHTSTAPAPELAGGHWLRGKELFFSESPGCSKCHRIRGEGGEAGPDLSNLVHRDYVSVLKDIREPNSAINPDHLAYHVERADGEALTAILKTESRSQLTFAAATGSEVTLARDQIRSIRPASLSLMPEGLLEGLTGEQQRDLMTFLLTSPLDPAPLEIAGAPAPRALAEVNAVLAGAPGSGATIQNPRSKIQNRFHVVLCSGPKDHGPGEHDYPLWQRRWAKLLALADGVSVSTAEGWPVASQFREAHTIIFYSNNPGWNGERARELEAFLARGGGAVYLHWAVEGHRHVDELAAQIGLAWRDGFSKFRHGPVELRLHGHPLAAGFSGLKFVDESYWQLVGDPGRVTLLASGPEEGAEQPLVWTRTSGAGRLFVSILGHYTWTFDDPLFRLLILRGICWTGGQPMDRLAELSTIGARVASGN